MPRNHIGLRQIINPGILPVLSFNEPPLQDPGKAMTQFHRTYRQTPTMPPYQRYAQAYDLSGQVRFALLVHIYLREVLALHPVQGRRLLDLACGTGTLAFLMAERGWSVVGVDASAAMLAMAAERVAENPGATVQFLQGDMRTLAGTVSSAAFDLVTCTYDSLNYMLTHDDLAACFDSAARALAPGGLYVADMNTRHFLEFGWGTCAIHEQSGYVQVERSHFEPTSSLSTMLLTGFLGDETSGYERFDELHVERAYSPDEVADLFKRAGLTVEASYDSFTLSSPGPETQRIFWVARKSQ